MTETPEVHAGPVVKVARDLTEIVALALDLEEQAINDANDREMPGGDALAALAPVANLEAWEHQYAALEALGRPTNVDLEDDQWEPPLQTLCSWSEQWRVEHGAEYGQRPTIASEAAFIKWALDWAWDNELHWDDFAKDIKAVRARLEDLLSAGLRSKKGVPCLSDECEGAILIQPVANRQDCRLCDALEPNHEPHDRGGLRDEWKCPKCDRRYGAEDYRRAVAQSAFLNAQWLPLGDVETRTGIKGGTVKVWALRGHVRKRKDVASGRVVYHMPDIEARQSEEVAS